MKRFDCLRLLARFLDPDALTVTSLSSNAHEWSYLWKKGPNFYGLNMGLCLGFAMGLALTFPHRKVVSLDSDGSCLLDTSALVTLGQLAPPNLLAVVFDNQSYGPRMGPTPTAARADLVQMARGAGVESAREIEDLEDFERSVRDALGRDGPAFYVVKVEGGREATGAEYRLNDGRPVKELFVAALRQLPDYRGP